MRSSHPEPVQSCAVLYFPRTCCLRSAVSSTLAALVLWTGHVEGATAVLQPAKDNSIYSESNASNGIGGLFAGETVGGNLRRALLEFDIAGEIPAGSIIDSVTLSLTQTKIGPAGSALFELHPLLASWGEGTSFGTGSGGLATPGDATWNFAHFSTTPWLSAGGDFGPVSGTALFLPANGVYTFATSSELVVDVQAWLNTPTANFGWILKAGDESPGTISARQFGSAQGSPIEQPTLTIEYTAVPEPGAMALLGITALAAAARRIRGRKRDAGLRPGDDL